tara:strand:+ start:1252 stop:1449 length:198 start_codon:yes stop_codon:yes gene_type:complete
MINSGKEWDWIQQLYYEEMLRNNTERSHDEHERYDQSIEKNREGNTRIPDGMQTQESNHKNDTDG